jgi:eukaryotic-like serine/threonine-protein kinase
VDGERLRSNRTSVRSETSWAAGTQVGAFEVLRLLGRGGMGEVYLARDPHLRRHVALKVIAPALLAKPRAVERFLLEARAVAKLDHPNIVRVHAVGTHAGTPFVALEYVDGPNLRQRLGDRVPLDDALLMAQAMASALCAAHRRGILHRDLKPENVVVGSDGRLRIVDFGLAQRVLEQRSVPSIDVDRPAHDEDEDDAHGSGIGHGGTPHYMAPEQWRREPCSRATDVWALGVILFELCAGRLPFDDDTLVTQADDASARGATLGSVVAPTSRDGTVAALHRLQMTICSDAPAPPVRDFADVPAAVGDLVARCLAKDPRARPAAADVERALAGISVRKEPTSEAPVTREAARGDRRLPSLAVVFALGASLAIAFGDAAPAREPATLAASPAVPSSGAAASYADAMKALRAGRDYRRLLERAVEEDAAFAPAHLWLALEQFSWEPSEARRHFRVAHDHADRLDERDRALLETFEPVVSRDPPDPDAMMRRADAVAARFPADADVAFLYARAASEMPGADLERVVAAFDHVIALEPRYLPALHKKAEFEAYMGRIDEAEASVRRCLEIEPDSMSCLRIRAILDEPAGRCDRVLDSANRRIALDPDDAAAYELKASALVAQGNLAGAKQALEQAWSLRSEESAARVRSLDQARLAALAGDFARAERHLDELAVAVAGRSDESDHAQGVVLRVAILLETDRAREAADAARSFTARRAGLVPDPRAEDFALARDAAPILARALRVAGAVDQGELERLRREWRHGWNERAGPWLRGHVWVKSLAFLTTPEEAAGAVAERAALPAFAPLMLIDAPVGRVLLDAGRADDALPHLERAVADCRTFSFPVEHVWAWLDLGRAREAVGDEAGACAAYQEVTRSWADARPPALSAHAAARASARLGCPER